MEVKTLQKKTKKLGDTKPKMKEETLPAIDVETLRYGSNSISEKSNLLHKRFGKYAGLVFFYRISDIKRVNFIFI